MSNARIPPVYSLAAYGTLRPGESNHWVVAHIDGQWRPGTVRGWTFTIGWGDAEGYPGFVADQAGQDVAVSVLTSDELDANLDAIDEFEGAGYRRGRIDVRLDDDTTVEAWIYLAVTDNPDGGDDRPKTKRSRTKRRRD